MKISDVIEIFKSIKNSYGDIEVCHYNNADYWKYPIDPSNIKIVRVKKHPDGCKPYCNPSDQWLSGQAKFDKQKSFIVVQI